MRALIRILTVLVLLVSGFALPSAAQEGVSEPPAKVVIDKRKLLVPPRNPDGSFIEAPFSEDPVRWARDKQQNFYRQLSGAIRGLKSSSPMAAGWTLVFLSFLYGVFHAAGPGHGKAVISGWVLATENDLRRGIVIAALSALFQALTAIVIVSSLLLFVSSASAMARDVAAFLESASYLMIAGLGLYLAWSGLRPWQQHDHAPAPVAPKHVHKGMAFEIVTPLRVTHEHVHSPDCGCGHVHLPEAGQLRGDWSWSRAVALAFAVGLRPCTGALLVLIFSWGLGVYWAGILATLAMGVGVFITISLIAALAVFARSTALRYAGLGNQTLARVVSGLRLVIGLGIAVLGGLLFWASLGSNNAMM
jgi:nickel/cobalt exporter